MTPLPLVQYFWQSAGALQPPLLTLCMIIIAELFFFLHLNICLTLSKIEPVSEQ